MLIIVAISASTLLYIWLNSVIGTMHYNNPALYEKISISAGNITKTSNGNYTAYAYVQNSGSPVTISSVVVLYYNNSLIYFNNTPSGDLNIKPNSVGLVYASNNTKVKVPSGSPVIIEVITANGVKATYQTTWP